MDASPTSRPGGVILYFWAATRNHAKNHALPCCCTHTLLLLDRVHGQGGRDTHTHTAASNGGGSGGNVWLVWGPSLAVVAVFPFSVVLQRGRPFSLWRERERGRRVTPQQPACVAHTTQRERDGSRVCPILLLLLAFGGGGERRDIGWLGLCGSIGWFLVVVLAAAGACTLFAAEAGGGTHHTTHQQQRSFLENGVLLTAVLCTSLHSLWARGCVASAAAVAVKRWWKLEASCSNSSSSGTRPAEKIFPLIFFQRHFFFFASLAYYDG